ncbi:MAG: tRNA (N(6)-L-threonylcarbamoyladenosine(37)-C(2))-methylthiotransferase MtaB [Rhodobacterales bacterium]|nr:tRNA (N(6)-L-threonylcarbamoyladenosine(37)-C(2))-methylthiotransferase MtaB [Rhodobacterales bacterium]
MENNIKFSTLGCRLNSYETESMRNMAGTVGLNNAVVINTCAVTHQAVSKSRQEIRRLRRENPNSTLIVTGCAAQIDPMGFSKMGEVDFVLGNSEKMRPEIWSNLASGASVESERVQVDDIMSISETASHLIDGFGTRSRAYVQIQNGCDHRCTFCTIPFGRGNSRSVPAGVVVEQIKRLVQKGYNEIVLTGVDLTSWGADLPMHPKLGNLITRILRLVPDLNRLRISSIDSIEVDEEFLDAIATERRLMPHFHLSLQHGDDLILKRMKRRHLREDAILFCEQVRKLRPEVTFAADIIAGFPTESNEHFENSIKLVEECGLTWLHIFPYSKRDGTPAARMPQVGGRIIKSRAELLRSLGKKVRSKHLKDQIGRNHKVLMESSVLGRPEHFAEVLFAWP